MIIVAAPEPEVTLHIQRVVTVDSTGDERFWDPDDLAAQHPEVFTKFLNRTTTIRGEPA